MDTGSVVSAIDEEIARLENIRALLLEAGNNAPTKMGSFKRKKDRLSTAGRARIAAAVRKRWAAVRAAKK